MEPQKKPAGRKPIDPNDRRKAVTVFIKAKYAVEAYIECMAIAKKYNEKRETKQSEPVA